MSDVLLNFNQFKSEDPPSTMKVQGEVVIKTLSENDCVFNTPLYLMQFKNKSHTFWRKCSGGVIFLVLKGNCMIRTKDSVLRVLNAGELIRIKPNEEHFFGAASNEETSVLTILTNLPNNDVTYLNEVTPKDLLGLEEI